MILSFRDLDGRPCHQHVEYPSPIPFYKSAPQEQWAQFLKELFKGEFIFEEFYVKCLGLWFDFYMPHRKLMIEVDGRQHQTYNKFFHGSLLGFRRAELNDQRKNTWCKINEIDLVRIRKENEKQQRELFLVRKYGRSRKRT